MEVTPGLLLMPSLDKRGYRPCGNFQVSEYPTNQALELNRGKFDFDD